MLLTTMMQSYYEKPVILLIDEYDVPVAKANNNGYYDEMLDVMKCLMQALKDNRAIGVVQLNQHNLQVVIGPQVQSVKDEMAGLMHTVQA